MNKVTTRKNLMLKALNELSDDAGYDEAIEKLYVLAKIEKGMSAGRAGDKVSLEEARKLAAKWQP